MMTLLLSLALAAASANPAGAENDATSTQTAKPAKPRKVCDKVEVTGSTVPKRICRTVTEPVQTPPEAQRADTGKPDRGATN